MVAASRISRIARRSGPAVVAAAMVLLLASPDRAPGADRGILTGVGDSLRWSGTATTGVVVPGGSACTALTCETETIRLRLGDSLWRRPAGLLVSLRWPDRYGPGDIGYDLDLYVYGPNGELAGKSDMWNFSTNEGVWVQDPAAGAYRVVIVPKTVVGKIPYQVAATIERGYTLPQSDEIFAGPGVQPDGLPYHTDLVVVGRRGPKPSRPLLPDLAPLPAHNFHLETTAAAGFYFTINHGLGHPPSCYPQETLGIDSDHPGPDTPHPTRCLRFDQALVNLGRGPYELRVYGNRTDAFQAIYRSDGGYGLRRAGQAEFSPAHGHLHFVGFDETGLYEIAPDGGPGPLVASQPDKGRCATDSQNVRFGKPGAGPPRYYVPSTCDTSDHQDPADPRFPGQSYFRSGIASGYDDNYPWFIPDQYIDVTGVPDGRYLIVDRINQAGNVVESDTTNDVAVTCVELTRTSAHRCPLPLPR